MTEKRARVIAYYLPQFHPVPVNDKFWGKGFTEWTNVAKAKSLFKGHQQPRVPADLGFYDLRLEEIREEQARLAQEAGIEGFCYWHYWFGNGKEVLEMPFDKVVESGKPNFPFCLGWANHDWSTKTWDKGKNMSKDTIIFKQEYPGQEDHIKHFYRLLPAFKDSRYIKVDGKLLFAVFGASRLNEPKQFMNLWNKLANENGLNGFHFVALCPSLPDLQLNNLNNIDSIVEKTLQRPIDMGFDAVNSINIKYAELKTSGKFHKIIYGAMRRLSIMPFVEKYKYNAIMSNYFTFADKKENVYPQLLAGWDRSPRAGKKAIVYYGDTPEAFKNAAESAVKCVENKDEEHRIIFLNSWNEWGEGAYMEPDLRFGKGKIEALRNVLNKQNYKKND